MSHPEQSRPAGHPDEQRAGHERPGGYDEDPLQNAGVPGQQQGGQYADPQGAPYGGQHAPQHDQHARSGGWYAEQLGGAGQHAGQPADQYGQQPAGGGYTEQLGGAGQHAGSGGGGYAEQLGGAGQHTGQPADQYGQQHAGGGYTEQLGGAGQHADPYGQQPGQAPGAQSYGAGPGSAGGAGDVGQGGQPGVYPGPPDHARGAPGDPAAATGAANGGPTAGTEGGGTSIIDPQRAEHWRSQWEDVRMMFVDQPRDAVARADGLVGEVLDELARTFTQQRSALDPNAVGDPSTEELRRAVQRYREFFDRLLSL
ncbi:hypothetical protein [Actinomycetospora aeridis]|uniref:Uncharacterized protein n=1 Tax=Actinomycetospora aeridis TaxID=3129231 RepID=A0ABU8N4V9_9PSEU